jgi:hypothetical protein
VSTLTTLPAPLVKRAPSPKLEVKPSTAQLTSPSTSAAKLKLICGGKVYRSLAETSPAKALKLYDPAAGLLGEPDEEVTEAVAMRKRRRLITPDPDFASDIEIGNPSPFKEPPSPYKPAKLPPTPTSQRRPALRIEPQSPFDLSAASALSLGDCDASTAPLPEIYATVLSLHSALERGLVLYLATEGGRTAGVLSSTSTDADGTMRARLPNIITFRSLRAMVERGSGRRFGSAELAQLKWLWDLDEPLGYTVTKMRELDPSGNNKRVNVWGIGVELVVKHNAHVASVSLVGAPPCSPSRSANSTKSGRDSMSIVALWSQASEARITEVRRRLGAYTLWQLQVCPPALAAKERC